MMSDSMAPYRHRYLRVRHCQVSMLIPRHPLHVVALLAILLTIMTLVAISAGNQWLTPQALWQWIRGDADGATQLIVGQFRLPRILLALCAGAALGMSGVLVQSIIRNPLASPDILGINSGAATAVVLFFLFAQQQIPIVWLPLIAFAAAALMMLTLLGLSRLLRLKPGQMILAGIGCATLLDASRSLLVMYAPTWLLGKSTVWMTGSVHGARFDQVWLLAGALVLLVPLLIGLLRHLTVQLLGEDTATSLGCALSRWQWTGLMLSAALSALAVGFVGGIGFIALMAPHIARRWVGNQLGFLLVCAALTGSLLLLIADTVGRTIMIPLDIPAGVFTAMLGAPYFLYLLLRR
ncbi:FecCD family ABC transporter permease [Plesiomonas shigelloides]|uniref:FecCD family ABC transporter permease n=1 Tax=Plesiomonas shigelloides TaxID=703 RepID=UPI001E4ED48F|nr:iron ABC transporter permease [Plesiomonas shigelloides]